MTGNIKQVKRTSEKNHVLVLALKCKSYSVFETILNSLNFF